MTLPSSGTISFGSLQTEFGGSHPITMAEYNGYTGIGSTVEVSLDDFYGLYRRPLHPSRLSTDTSGLGYCQVDNAFTTASGTDQGTGSYTALSIDVTAGQKVIVALYGYADSDDDDYNVAGFYGKANTSAAVTTTAASHKNTGNIGTPTDETTWSIPTSSITKMYSYPSVDQGDWHQTSVEFTATQEMINISGAAFTFMTASYLNHYRYFDVTFT